MANLNELQQRLAVASERNRQNNEKRAALLLEAKEKYGCSTVEELSAKVEEKRAEAVRLTAEAEEANRKAEAAVLAVEAAVGVRA
jgi:hypothetical protein